MRSFVHFTLAMILSTVAAWAARTSFDENWKFVQKEVSGAEQANSDDSSWRVLDVPHDWSIEGD